MLWSWAAEMLVICALAVIDAGAGLQESLEDGAAIQRDGFGVLDVADDGGEAALDIRSDPAFHFLGVHAGVLPDGGDDGDIDIWENIGGGAQNYDRTDKKDEQRQHDKGVGAGES